MNLKQVCHGYLYLLFTAINLKSQPLNLPSYDVSLYSEDLKLSTVLWLKPAYCLYEEWMKNVLDTSVALRKTSKIQVQIKITDDLNIYIVPNAFSVPQCSPLSIDPETTQEFAYKVGPNIDDINGGSVQRILPGKSYQVRYMLYNAQQKQIAYTNWSNTFETREMPQNPQDMPSWLQGRSGGMVVITVLLSIAMFILLVGLGVTLSTTQH